MSKLEFIHFSMNAARSCTFVSILPPNELICINCFFYVRLQCLSPKDSVIVGKTFVGLFVT